MKKLVLFMIFGILLVGFVIAQSNGTQGTNESGNGTVGGADEGNRTTVTVNKTRVDKDSITFLPWEKRNESECLEGCSCQGAVMSCPTETGKIMTITAGRSGNIIVITIDQTEVETEMELEQERDRERNRTRLKARMSNGETKEIKIMPDVAAERALERLRLRACSEENGCVIELKEVGKDKELAYEIQAERHAKLLGMFRTKMEVKAQVSAETGELIRVKKPWWAFLASEPEE